MDHREREITPNARLEEMRADRSASARMVRGDEVKVWPSRGLPVKGLLVDPFAHPLYGLLYDVLVGGKVTRFEAERVSRWRP
jgi:hypothetical protein